jgi:hypothetical protein
VKQSRLKFGATSKPDVLRQQPGFDAGNLQSARLVLADVERFGGEDAGLVQWARTVTKRLEGQAT